MRAVIMIPTLAIFVCWFFTARANINPDVRFYNCEEGAFDAKSDAEKVSNYILEYVRDHAADPGYNVQKHDTIGYDTYYGQAACDGTISQDDCRACAQRAYVALLQLCVVNCVGGWAKLDSCRIRYSSKDFDPNY